MKERLIDYMLISRVCFEFYLVSRGRWGCGGWWACRTVALAKGDPPVTRRCCFTPWGVFLEPWAGVFRHSLADILSNIDIERTSPYSKCPDDTDFLFFWLNFRLYNCFFAKKLRQICSAWIFSSHWPGYDLLITLGLKRIIRAFLNEN